MFQHFGMPNRDSMVTLPTGTNLKVDRVYIRKGAKDFSSITFFMVLPEKKSVRFWAKIPDVNTMEGRPILALATSTLEWDWSSYREWGSEVFDHEVKFGQVIEHADMVVNTVKGRIGGVHSYNIVVHRKSTLIDRVTPIGSLLTLITKGPSSWSALVTYKYTFTLFEVGDPTPKGAPYTTLEAAKKRAKTLEMRKLAA